MLQTIGENEQLAVRVEQELWSDLHHQSEHDKATHYHLLSTDANEYCNIRIPNTIREYSFILINMFIGLNRATILAFAA